MRGLGSVSDLKTWGFALLVASAAALSVGCGGDDDDDNAPPDTEPPGVPTNPANTWVRCECSGCTVNGQPAGTDRVGGCAAAACGGPTLANDCAAICSAYGFTSCAATTPLTDSCLPARCELCAADAECSEGACYAAGRLCSKSCNENGNCGQCDLCSERVCSPQPAELMCTPPPPAPAPLAADAPLPGTRSQSYLDRQLGKTSFDLNTSSSLTFSAPNLTGGGSISAGAISMLAPGCPGSGCTARLNDLFVVAAHLPATVSGVIDLPAPVPDIPFSEDHNVDNVLISLVRPTTLDIAADGGFRIPAGALEVMAGFDVDGDHSGHRAISSDDLSGAIDFATGEINLVGTVSVGGANLTFDLKGGISNRPPVARAGADLVVECAGATTAVALNGAASTDATPGPGISDYRWYTNFDRTTGFGSELASGASPSASFALGAHVLTLQTIDGSGAMSLDDQSLLVRDTVAPVIQVPRVSVEICSPDKHVFQLPLPQVTEVCTGSPDLKGEVIALNGQPLTPPITLTNGRANLSPGSLRVRWTARDASGNESSAVQEIEVVARPALYSRVALTVADSVKVIMPGGGPAGIANLGVGQTSTGVLSRVGNVFAGGPVVLRDRALVDGFIKTHDRVTRQNNVVVNGLIFEQVEPVFAAQPPLVASFPAPGIPIPLEPNQSASPAPGSYGQVVVKTNATLNLRSGSYFMTSLQIEPGANVRLSKSAGPIQIYVKDSLIFRSSFQDPSNDATNLLLFYAGTAGTFIEAPFSGSIVAPNAKLDLATVPSQHAGTFFAREIEVRPSVTILHRPYLCTEP